MTRINANNNNLILSTNDFALITNFFYGSSYFHEKIFEIKTKKLFYE